MTLQATKIFGCIFLLLLPNSRAQVQLPTLSLGDICTNGLAGGKSTTTTYAEATGGQRIPAGDYWNQIGAVWVLSTNNDDVFFYDLGFGVGPDGAPAADTSALSLNPSSKAWTLSIPSAGVCECPSSHLSFAGKVLTFIQAAVDIVWEAGTKPKTTPTSTAPTKTPTWTHGACKSTSVLLLSTYIIL